MKIAAITGGSRGIGASAAKACAGKGMGVVITYEEGSEAADHVVRSIKESGESSLPIKLNVSNSKSFSKFRYHLKSALEIELKRDMVD